MARPSIPTDLTSLKPIVEAMIFASEEPLGPRTLLRVLFEEERKGSDKVPLFDAAADANGDDEEEGKEESGEEKGEEAEALPRNAAIGQKELRTIIDELNESYDEAGRSFRIIEIAGGFQFATTREYGEFVGLLSRDRMRRKLSPAALETLAIVAYRQPVTKPEVEAIRGVNCDQVLLSLLERNLIAISGRADTVGKPLLYSTTDEFLRSFGMNSLSDLPKLRELEELMEEDAHSATKPEIIPEEVTDELLELTVHIESSESGEIGEEVSNEGSGADEEEAIEGEERIESEVEGDDAIEHAVLDSEVAGGEEEGVESERDAEESEEEEEEETLYDAEENEVEGEEEMVYDVEENESEGASDEAESNESEVEIEDVPIEEHQDEREG